MLLACFVLGCSSHKLEKPDNLLSPQKMEDVLVDINLTEAALDQMSMDSRQIVPEIVQQYDSVFQKHQIQADQFKISYEYYLADGKQMQKIYEKVVERLTILSDTRNTSK